MVKDLRGWKEREPLLVLAGTSLRVYFYLLENSRSKPVGVRELQRAMGFKSPSTAKHHLDRLEELGLAERVPGGEYRALPPTTGLLALLFFAYRKLLPWSLPFAVLGLTLSLTDILVNGVRDPLLLFSTLLLSVILFYQTIVIIRWLNILKGGENS